MLEKHTGRFKSRVKVFFFHSNLRYSSTKKKKKKTEIKESCGAPRTEGQTDQMTLIAS